MELGGVCCLKLDMLESLRGHFHRPPSFVIIRKQTAETYGG